MRVFLDTNVLLDYLLKREPFYDSAKKVFLMCLHKIEGLRRLENSRPHAR